MVDEHDLLDHLRRRVGDRCFARQAATPPHGRGFGGAGAISATAHSSPPRAVASPPTKRRKSPVPGLYTTARPISSLREAPFHRIRWDSSANTDRNPQDLSSRSDLPEAQLTLLDDEPPRVDALLRRRQQEAEHGVPLAVLERLRSVGRVRFGDLWRSCFSSLGRQDAEM